MKTTKKFISLFVALAVIIGIIPMGILPTSAANDNIQSKIDQVLAVYPSDSFFTSTGYSSEYQCDGYYCAGYWCQQHLSLIPARGCLPAGSTVPYDAHSCCAFAHYLFYYIFGTLDKYPVNTWYPSKGDIVQFNNGHYAVCISSDDYNCYVYESNYGSHGKVKYWSTYSKSSIANVWHASNYDSVNSVNENYNIAASVTSPSNTSANINMSISPNASPSAWGFYIDKSHGAVSSGNADRLTVSTGNFSFDVSTYAGLLQPGTKYYYKLWANIGNKTWYSPVSSFSTTNVKPAAPKLSVAGGSSDIGIGDSPTVTWKATANTDKYILKLYDSNNDLVQSKDVAAVSTQYTFQPIEKAGIYKAYVTAYNTAGTAQSYPAGTIVVHPDVTVTFADANPTGFADYKDGDPTSAKILKTATVHYGHNVSAPADPEHTGYTFTGWDKALNNICADTVITAKYKINTYTVTFKNENGAVLKTEKVTYYSSAAAPDYEVTRAGYVFAGWDKAFDCITGDIAVTAISKWYNSNYAVHTTVSSAVRDDDDNGYNITVQLANNADKLTTGRIVTALKTSDNKLLASTESSAFSIKADATKSIEIFIPYENAAKLAYAYVVDNYSTMIPISAEAKREIDMGLDWTSWSTEKPAAGTYDELESRTEYRYKTRSNTTSYDTSLSGWTQNGYDLVAAESGTIDYVPSWPAGFDRNNYYYNTYSKTPKYASETLTQLTKVSTSTIGYLYWHWYPNMGCSSEASRWVSAMYGELLPNGWYATQFEAFFNYGTVDYDPNIGGFKAFGHSNYSYWWMTWGDYNSDQLAVQRCNYTTYNKRYKYYKTSGWSDWSVETQSDFEEKETRTVYRYRPKDASVEESVGTLRTVSGKLDSAYSGQQLTLYIYKINEASDYSNEYIGQTAIAADGSYSFSFKLREEPTVETGDYTVALGLEGSNSLIFTDPIAAPRKTHTVKFFDWDGTLLSTQTVKDGGDAVLPPENSYNKREGYKFRNWTATNLNVHTDKEIYAEYEINKYTVVFVDWEARTVQIKEFEHGAPLIAPDFEEADDNINVVWDKVSEGVTEVTRNMVICTEYSVKKYKVNIYDWDNKLIDTQTVEYGFAVRVPDMADDGSHVFMGWKPTDGDNILDDYIITSRTDICPAYVFSTTTETPAANMRTGEYSNELDIELTCPTEGATIFYTLDGTDPSGENGILYTKPIHISDFAELKFYACCMNKNDSKIVSESYAVNPNEETSGYLTAEELPDYVKGDPDKYNVKEHTSYFFKDTANTKSVSESNEYIKNGWTLESTEYSEWSEWKNGVPDEVSSDIIGREYEQSYDSVLTEVPSYRYSVYVYILDGVMCYSNEERPEYNGHWEYAEVAQSEGYALAGFTEDGIPYYYQNDVLTDPGLAEPTPWFNRTEATLTEVQLLPIVRYRYKVNSFYRWTEELCFERPTGDTREYRTTRLYTYDFLKHYIVTFIQPESYYNSGISKVYEKNALIAAEDIPEYYGYRLGALYKDADKAEEWNMQTDVVTETTVLYTDYTPLKFKVTFAYKDGTVIANREVDYLSAAVPPENIELPRGYRFLGWDNDEYKCVTKDINVTAKYISDKDYATVTLDKKSVKIFAGTEVTLEANVSLAGKTVLWSSDNEAVAYVDKNGRVNGIAPGKAVITATVSDSGEKATCTVTVIEDGDTQIHLNEQSTLGIDSEGYIREVKAETNTVAEVLAQFKNSNLVIKDKYGNQLADSDRVGTGAVVCLMNGSEVLDSRTFIMCADMNGDGKINNRDAAMLMRYLVNKETASHTQELAIDVNGDGNINNRDAAMIMRYMVGKEIL